MKASELRIGNIVTIENPHNWAEMTGVPVEVFGIMEHKCLKYHAHLKRLDRGFNWNDTDYWQFLEYVKPIPITPEWLERFGFSFNRSVAVFNEFQKGNIIYMVWKNGRKDLGLDTNVVSYGNKHIKCQFVHQLQNLYYALTGEELTLKSELK